MEMARRALIYADWAKVDGEKLQVPRAEMLMERKIKTINEAYGSTTGPEEPRTGHWPTASRPCDQARAVG